MTLANSPHTCNLSGPERSPKPRSGPSSAKLRGERHTMTNIPISETKGKPPRAPDPWKTIGDTAQAVLAKNNLAGGKKDADATE
jgi:hypothetical protein